MDIFKKYGSLLEYGVLGHYPIAFIRLVTSANPQVSSLESTYTVFMTLT